jgi:predicted  nucleic acid-binding Zn-ribbon protein
MADEELKVLTEEYKKTKADVESSAGKIEGIEQKIARLEQRISRLGKGLAAAREKKERMLDDLASGVIAEPEYHASTEQHTKMHNDHRAAVAELRQLQEVLQSLKEERATLVQNACETALRLSDYIVSNEAR